MFDLLLAAGGILGATFGVASDEAPVDYNRDVRPILSEHCFACHGPDEGHRMAGLRLDRRDAATAERRGARAIAPGDADHSEIWQRITTADEGDRMPPPSTGRTVRAEQREVLRRWIEQGAPHARHWAWQKPLRHEPPALESDWIRDPVDAFVLRRMREQGLEPNPEADRATLIRRWSLDLTGVPPTLEEVDAYLRDDQPGADERVVDRLLASPRYAERWARVWLDLARYADSAGYGSDPLRTIWRYRDWVIEAFDRNQPYDEFTIEQLAGDLLPQPSTQQLLATAFHRNTMTNTEGGTDDEEFRVAAVKDRVHTTMQVWMGITAGCAQCHSHKFDPLSMEEYYRLFAFFDQTEDRDLPGEEPRIPTPTPRQQEELDALDAELAVLDRRLAEPGPEVEAGLRAWWASRDEERESFEALAVEEVLSEGGASFRALDDGSWLAQGASPERDSYRVTAAVPEGRPTALRLEVLPHEDLEGPGPGRASHGNFVVGSIDLHLRAEGQVAPLGRRVRLSLSGGRRFLSLAEVEVYRDGVNVARSGQATQSSTDYGGDAERAIDGNTSGDYDRDQSVTHTRREDAPWWELSLAEAGPIDRLVVFNRTGGDLARRLDGVLLEVFDDAGRRTWHGRWEKAPDVSRAIEPGKDGLEVPLVAATADFSQDDWGVGRALDDDATKGWAVAPQLGRAHEAIFELAWPQEVPAGAKLFVTLRQDYGSRHTLGRFRLSFSRRDTPPRAHPHDVRAVIARPMEEWSEAEAKRVRAYYFRLDPSLAAIQAERDAVQRRRDALKPVTTPILRELPEDRRRTTHVLIKGNFLTKGEAVSAAVPEAWHTFPEDAALDRLGLARWLVHPDNPLTGRVSVNRFWARLFGRGLVETEEDFGTQGTPPTHPELLDTLARDFVEGGWDVKALLRRLVLTASYRQSSRVTPEHLQRDASNHWLARATRRRLEAEMVRDQALALAGLLSDRRFGPSVHPPQPEGMWQAAFNGQRDWPTSQGEDRYRRGLYVFWRRTVPYPSMATFDAPSRELCTVRRIATNTPLQAFVTLNDPVYVEAAQALGRRLMREGGEGAAARVAWGLRLCTAQPPSEEQVSVLVSLYEAERARAATQPDEARSLATDPLGPLPEGFDPAEAAAWTVVANVLLNMDRVLTRG